MTLGEIKKAEEPELVIKIHSFQGKSHHAFLPNYRRYFYIWLTTKNTVIGISLASTEFSKVFRIGSMHWCYPHITELGFAIQHSQLIPLLFHRNRLRIHKSLPVLIPIKEIQRQLKADNEYVKFLWGTMPKFQ